MATRGFSDQGPWVHKRRFGGKTACIVKYWINVTTEFVIDSTETA
jgi:hypothetical protein